MLEEFERTLGHLLPSTRQAYLSSAGRALRYGRSAGANPASAETLRALLEGMAPREKRLRFGRIHRFEAFLAGQAEAPGPSAPKRAALRVFALRYRPLERPLDVRDAAFLAAVAVTGSAEAARALTLADVREGGGLLRIADRPAEGAAAEALRRWLGLRRRMLRPEQARLFRRGQRWAQSPLLFPAPDGKPLSRSAFANALRRFKRQAGEGARDA